MTAHNNISCNFIVSGYRLPSEAEWEYAAKGGIKAQALMSNEIYAGSSNPEEVAWYSVFGDTAPHPVAMKKPNALGLYDMAGNVWQWVRIGMAITQNRNRRIHKVQILVIIEFFEAGHGTQAPIWVCALLLGLVCFLGFAITHMAFGLFAPSQ